MKKQIAKPQNVIKQRTVVSPAYIEPVLSLFEVWQLPTDKWIAALEERAKDANHGACLLQYRPYTDYKEVAHVWTYTLDDVFTIMNCFEAKGAEERFFLLTPQVRSMSVGDVIVPTTGLPMYVGDYGYIPVLPE